MFSLLRYVPYMQKVRVCLLDMFFQFYPHPVIHILKAQSTLFRWNIFDSVVADLKVYASGGQGGSGTVTVFI